MKKRGYLIFLVSLMMTAGIVAGCKTTPSSTDSSVAPRLPPDVLSREIIDLALKNEVDIKNIQYYISKTVILKKNGNARHLSSNDKGEVFLGDTVTAQEEIVINQGTPGKLINTSNLNADGPLILEICFTSDKNDSLLFREDPRRQYFELMYNETAESKKVQFGDEEYMITFSEIPYLVIKVIEAPNNPPQSIVLQGVFVDSPVH
jgi:hypothetical protein